MTQGKQGERKSPSSSSQEMIVSVVFMAEHVTKKVIFNVNMKGMTGEEGDRRRERVCMLRICTITYIPSHHVVVVAWNA